VDLAGQLLYVFSLQCSNFVLGEEAAALRHRFVTKMAL